jgi:hypothetical protein
MIHRHRPPDALELETISCLSGLPKVGDHSTADVPTSIGLNNCVLCPDWGTLQSRFISVLRISAPAYDDFRLY